MPRGYSRNSSKSLYDHGTASALSEAAARDAGIERSLASQPKGWVNCAKLALKQVCIEQPTLTADDVWARIEKLGGGAADNNAAIAGVLKWGEGLGYLTSTLESALSTREGRHRSRIAVWRSKIHRTPTPEGAAWRETFGV